MTNLANSIMEDEQMKALQKQKYDFYATRIISMIVELFSREERETLERLDLAIEARRKELVAYYKDAQTTNYKLIYGYDGKLSAVGISEELYKAKLQGE